MSDFGGQLKQAREQRGISLRQIAAATKISIVALEALERNDFSRLPGGIFSRAFVRAYALEVGLDPELTVQEFLVEFEQNHNAAAEKAAPEVTADDRAFLQRQRRAARWLRGISIGLVVSLAALVVSWRLASSTGKSSSPSAGATASPPKASRPAPEAKTESVSPQAVSPPAPAPVAAPASAPPAAGENQIALRLQFTAECWVRATVDGTVVLEQILGAGDSRDIKPGREVYLQLGNAGAVRLWINGQPAKELGAVGQTFAERIDRATLGRYIEQ